MEPPADERARQKMLSSSSGIFGFYKWRQARREAGQARKAAVALLPADIRKARWRRACVVLWIVLGLLAEVPGFLRQPPPGVGALSPNWIVGLLTELAWIVGLATELAISYGVWAAIMLAVWMTGLFLAWTALWVWNGRSRT